MRAESHEALVDGERVRYFVAGTGPPVVLLHGLGGSRHVWHRNLPEIAKRYTVYAPDLWGPGRFKKREPFTLGGLVAGSTAVWAAERVRSITLVDSAGLGKEISLSQRLLTLPLVGELLFRPSRARVRRMLKLLVQRWDSKADDLVEELYAHRLQPGVPQQMLTVLRSGVNMLGMKRSAQLLAHAASVRAPSLIIWGSRDPLFPVAHGERAAGMLPDAMLHVVEGSGHWPYLEYPDEFNRVLLRFLDEQNRAQA